MALRSWMVVAMLCWAPGVFAQTVNCLVVGLSDGDTFTCLDATKTQHKVRLANIDTPETGQPYGTKSKELLSNFIFGKHVSVESLGVDRYGRTIGLVDVEGWQVNREMVIRGAAWVYPRYNQDSSLPALQEQARSASRGVWGLPQAQIIAPWEWRQLGRSLQSEFSTRKQLSAHSSTAVSGGDCGKRLCRQMTSCAEAKFHLEQCGVSSLDGDGDGVPCESLCR